MKLYLGGNTNMVHSITCKWTVKTDNCKELSLGLQSSIVIKAVPSATVFSHSVAHTPSGICQSGSYCCIYAVMFCWAKFYFSKTIFRISGNVAWVRSVRSSMHNGAIVEFHGGAPVGAQETRRTSWNSCSYAAEGENSRSCDGKGLVKWGIEFGDAPVLKRQMLWKTYPKTVGARRVWSNSLWATVV